MTYFNLDETPHIVHIGGYAFYFNTLLQVNKFRENLMVAELETAAKLGRVYKDIFEFKASEFSMFRLYHKIINRGFKVVWKDEVEWRNISEVQFEINVSQRLPL